MKDDQNQKDHETGWTSNSVWENRKGNWVIVNFIQIRNVIHCHGGYEQISFSLWIYKFLIPNLWGFLRTVSEKENQTGIRRTNNRNSIMCRAGNRKWIRLTSINLKRIIQHISCSFCCFSTFHFSDFMSWIFLIFFESLNLKFFIQTHYSNSIQTLIIAFFTWLHFLSTDMR